MSGAGGTPMLGAAGYYGLKGYQLIFAVFGDPVALVNRQPLFVPPAIGGDWSGTHDEGVPTPPPPEYFTTTGT